MSEGTTGSHSGDLSPISAHDQVRHDIKSELHAIKMGVLLIQQIAEETPSEISTILADTGVRIESCVDRIATSVDEAFRTVDAHPK